MLLVYVVYCISIQNGYPPPILNRDVCSDLPSLDNGMISYSTGSPDVRPVGSVATHSCTTMGGGYVGGTYQNWSSESEVSPMSQAC